jgi:pimeloyl-ACP methyl ester carboxylesterase
VGQAVYDLMTTDLRTEIARIGRPVLLIAADKTLGAKARLAYEAQVAKIPNHRLVVAPNALHFMMFDNPVFLFEALDDILTEGPAYAR